MDRHIDTWLSLMNEADSCATLEQLDALRGKADVISKQHPPTFDDFLYHRMALRLVSGYERLVWGNV